MPRKPLLSDAQVQTIRDMTVTEKAQTGLALTPENSQEERQLFRQALKAESVDFFRKILTDEMESRFWSFFMTGNEEMQIGDVEGMKMVNPYCLKAFLKAVEYKRGLPIALQPSTGDNGVKVIVQTIGAGQEFFADMAKSIGIRTIERTSDKKAKSGRP